jgi:hypothetical protein
VHGFPAGLDIYPQPFVELRDVLKIAPWAAFRHQLREWGVRQSDSPNMDTLYNPRICQPQLDHLGLMSPSCPLVLVMEELGRRGWKCQSDTRPLVPLLSAHAGVYALAMWNNRRLAYFQCLLALGELWARGLTRFVHGQPSGYYALLFKSDTPALVPLNAGPNMYSEDLANAGAGNQGVLRVTAEDDVVGSDHGQDDEVMGEAPLLEDAEHEPEPVLDGVVCSDGEDCPRPPMPSSSSSSSSSSSEQDVVAGDVETNMPRLHLPFFFWWLPLFLTEL